jgi:iron complex outermembrane receptor protein
MIKRNPLRPSVSAFSRLPRHSPITRETLLALTIATVAAGTPQLSQAQNERSMMLEEVIVTAQRREESIQDVPISMTIMSQEQLNNANIITATDLATYTPSLQTNNRFGADSTTFSIRGFTQELRTTASVGVYFSEVIAARGANTSSSGDGAGPGDFFDLENVQVLKGPQGTLFGRNTTGGAILLTPKKPTDVQEGYLEVSAGNYDMKRAQGVFNLPVNDRFRLRFGIDHQKRDGFLNNVSGIGPDELGNIDYTAFRASAVIDITDNLENYTIIKASQSDNHNTPGSIFACNTDAGGLGAIFSSFCTGDFANRAAMGGDDFYDVWSNMEDPVSKIEQWQVINTTTWELNDNLTLKNIASYTETESDYQSMVYGSNFRLQSVSPAFADHEVIFAMAGLAHGTKQSASSTFVEEIQLQGTSFDERLTWQAGLYYEKTKPTEDYGSQNPGSLSCDRSTIQDPNPANWRCNDVLGALMGMSYGTIGSQVGGVTYENKAVYLQGTYDLTDQFSMTLGLRYTNDETKGYVDDTRAFFPSNPMALEYYAPIAVNTVHRTPETKSEEPTGVIGLDYKPNDDTLLYAKYTRGYRQGGVNLATEAPINTHDPEQVDSYEVGAKLTLDGPVVGTLNLSAFYNDFSDQQLQLGYYSNTGAGTTAVINAGESTIQGIEIEANLLLTENLRLNASYTYLDTEVKKVNYPDLVELGITNRPGSPTAAEGEPLSFAPKNKLVATLSYHLPVDAELGDISLSATYTYTDSYTTVSQELTQSPYAELDPYELVNFNMNWHRVMGSNFDMSLFIANAMDEEYITYTTGNWSSLGFESGQVGMPRMFGTRVRYSF